MAISRDNLLELCELFGIYAKKKERETGIYTEFVRIMLFSDGSGKIETPDGGLYESFVNVDELLAMLKDEKP